MSFRHRLDLFILALLPMLIVSDASADPVLWFSPSTARVTGQGELTSAANADAVRVSNTVGNLQLGSFSIPLSLASDAMVDAVLVCYRTNNVSFTSSAISGIELRTMTLPTSSTTVLADADARSSTAGSCDAIEVVDQTLQGAPTLAISYSLPQLGSWVELGAVGLRLKTPVVGALEPNDSDHASATLGRGRPNPFVATTSFEYVVPDAGAVEVKVYDVAGRLVRSLFHGTVAAGTHSARWDGLDDHGAMAPAGVYLARLETSRGTTSERLIRVQ